jgi:hypothetical protein
MRGRAQDPHHHDMTYVLIVTNSTADYEGYEQVLANLPTTRPEGMIARCTGMSDRGLTITAVWESKAHADRFSAEVLMPTIRATLGEAADAPAEVLVLEYEARDVELATTTV